MGYIGVFQQARRQQPSEVGAGYKVFDVVTRNGAEKDLVIFDRQSLIREIRLGQAYARANGELPNTEFWNVVADKYDDDQGFFALTHQCQPLLRLLGRYDVPGIDIPIVPPIDIPGTPGIPPIDNTPGVVVPPVDPPSVPEPSSVILMALGFLAMYVFVRKKGRIAPA